MNNLIRRGFDSIREIADLGDVVFSLSVGALIYGTAEINSAAAWILGGLIGIVMTCRGGQQ